MLKFITTDFRRNLTKLFCLTLGLAIGMLLVAKAYLEQTFDTSYPAAERIYTVTESVEKKGEFSEYPGTPGAIAPGLKQYVPQVEAATRYTSISGSLDIVTPDGRSINTDGVILADSCLFDVFSTRIIAGNPHEVLAVENQCMIPLSLAEKIGDDVIGMVITSPQMSNDYKITIGGVYEDYPLNTTMNNAIYLSMPSIRHIMNDGTENWVGNDRYRSYVLLSENALMEDVKPHIERMISENLPDEAINVFHLNFHLKPLIGVYTSKESVRTMVWVLSLLAAIILISASLNYLLIVIGQMGRRGKEMAVRKCYGTSNTKIFGRIIGESLFMLVIAVGLAVLFVICLSDECQQILGFTSTQLLCTGKVWLVEAVVCLGLLIITGVIPAWMYCKTPVSQAFRHDAGKRRYWKLALLAVQFFATGLLFCLLVLVFRQFRMMNHGDMGFEYENIATVYVNQLPQTTRAALVNELKSLSCVEDVSSAEQDFTSHSSGNNVWIKDDPQPDNQVNVADMYYANPNLFDVMGMEFVQGEPFGATSDSTVCEVVVEERFIDIMKKNFGVTDDNIIGQKFCITEHIALDGLSEFTICGVIKDIRRGGYSNDTSDRRAGVLFSSAYVRWIVYIRLHNLTPETLKEVQAVVDKYGKEYDLYVTPYKMFVDALNEPVKRFGVSVMLAGLAILLIAIIGLIGYTADEVQRRAKEIAVRKVNGTTATQILKMLCVDIMKIAVPSLIAGGAVAMAVGNDWLSQFTDRVSLSPLSMLLSILVLLIIIVAVVGINSLKVARSNPVIYLRNE